MRRNRESCNPAKAAVTEFSGFLSSSTELLIEGVRIKVLIIYWMIPEKVPKLEVVRPSLFEIRFNYVVTIW
jgi:hypothetical protein